uniref:Alpha-ketoglutarate-dependent dioxygenase AlkB-like domain-containing protein n=1 Tax=Daphnia galeata TaxID=27404 RepID=A0A8J2WJR4_9CRUS|nr:unnamed protein product [Daphnia galeata]
MQLLEELELKFKRSRYQYDHWDDAIHGYKETMKPTWNTVNDCVLNRLRNFSFSTTTMQHVHVLDLAENGHIKPHLDIIKFCGNTISGISLLTDSVMRLIHIEPPHTYISSSRHCYREDHCGRSASLPTSDPSRKEPVTCLSNAQLLYHSGLLHRPSRFNKRYIGSTSLASSTPIVSQSNDPLKRPFPIVEHQMQDDLIGPLNDTPKKHLELAVMPPVGSTHMDDSDCFNIVLFQDVNHFSENLDDEEADVTSSSNEVPSLQSLAVGFSPDETILLNEELRKHVQLLTHSQGKE